jgi:hypothetical protein
MYLKLNFWFKKIPSGNPDLKWANKRVFEFRMWVVSNQFEYLFVDEKFPDKEKFYSQNISIYF